MSIALVNYIDELLDLRTHCPLCKIAFAGNSVSEEHVFPKWLQRRYGLWTKRLTLPNEIEKRYDRITTCICDNCNHNRFGKVETQLALAADCSSQFEGFSEIEDEVLAVWLAKIVWLLARLSHSAQDHRTRNDISPNQILPNEIMPYAHWLGAFVQAYAQGKRMMSCYQDDPPLLTSYGASYSLYRFRIDAQGQPSEPFYFTDDFVALGCAIIIGDLGLICLYDDGLHQRWRSAHYEDYMSRTLHPIQFSELIGKMFYDQTVIEPKARQFTYYWNEVLNSVITRCSCPRHANPFLADNCDDERYVTMLERHIGRPIRIVSEGGKVQFTTFLKDDNGNFWDCVNNRPWRPTASPDDIS